MKNNLGITEQFFYSTFRIECLKSDGRSSIGTAFTYYASLKSNTKEENEFIPILVTNKHVIENSVKTSIWFHITDEDENILHGEQKKVELEGSDIWSTYLDFDIAYLGLSLCVEALRRKGIRPFFIGINKSFIPDNNEWLNIMPGDDIMMIGYPNGLWDSKNNLPILRKGVLASIPYIDFNQKNEFLIDCPVFPGSSGSPIFLVNFGRKLLKSGADINVFETKLIGILWGGPIKDTEGRVYPKSIQTIDDFGVTTVTMLNLGFCIKANILIQIESEIEQKNNNLANNKIEDF